VARDHVGIIPLYIGVSKENEIYIANEMKAIHDQCITLDIVKPGHYIFNGTE